MHSPTLPPASRFLRPFAVGVLICFVALRSLTAEAATPRLNVLFIAIDDLRPELGCYGFPQIKSPNIDDLAKRGLLFSRAYCQCALCNPSRASLLSGLRPETIQVYDLETFVRSHKPNLVTLPQLFKNNGYVTRSIGKIFHVTNGNHDDDLSWSARPWQSPWDDPKSEHKNANGQVQTKPAPFVGQTKKVKREVWAEALEARANVLPFRSPKVADNHLLDGQIADEAVRVMDEIKDRPFFLAVGFHKPHMPWVAPRKYWDMYHHSDIHLATFQQLPAGAPEFATNDGGEFRSYEGIPAVGPIPEKKQRAAIHSYFACISYVDALVGKVTAELDRLGLRKNTVIILWGDNGYQLGEHGTWNKRTNWEACARVPLIISVPGQPHAGEQTSALVELLDMYPTLAEVCGLKPPASLEGRSFVPLLSQPNMPWKTAAFTTYQKTLPELGPGFGRAMRTDHYRFVEWSGPDSDRRVYELYDEDSDPLETTNIADRPENAALVAKLTAELHSTGK
jgi:iduronate 2-sulfatase